MIHFDTEDKLLTASVGDLVRFGAPPAIRATPALASRLHAGAQEHRAWQQDETTRRAREAFHAEATIHVTVPVRDWRLRLEGRMDGVHKVDGAWVVEELKTTVAPGERFREDELSARVLDGTAYSDYRLQLEIYAWMLGERIARGEPLWSGGPTAHDDEPAQPVRARLVFRNLAAVEDELAEVAVEVPVDPPAVRRFVEARAGEMLDDFEHAEARRRAAAELGARLPFPFESYRPHQRELEETVTAALERGEQLLLSAPPGIGKTAAVLHAALAYALPRGLRVLWVTAKTTQQRIVAATLERMLELFEQGVTPQGALAARPLRAIVLRAREKMCPNLDAGGVISCDEDLCAWAHEFGRKLALHDAEGNVAALPVIQPEALRDFAEPRQICPYELSLELAAAADLIVGDYNYVFDPRSALRRLDLDDIAKRSVLVVDEAHNLHGRGRGYYSPRLELADLEALREESAHAGREASEPLHAGLDGLSELFRDALESGAAHKEGVAPIDIDPDDLVEIEREVAAARTRALVASGGLDGRDGALERVAAALGAWTAAVELAADGLPLAAFVDLREESPALRAVCLDASLPLGERLRGFRAVVAMSGTLEPPEFFLDVLGFDPERARAAAVPSPFPRERRRVLVVPDIATTYRARSRDAARVAALVDEVAGAQPGNYLVFLSSFAYLDDVLAHVDRARIGRDVIVQARRMREDERDTVLEQLREPGSRRILYGVQGGIFSEGVDYPGEMAVGVIVVGPGLPRWCYEEELVRAHFQETRGKGFEYAYAVPGMQRVVQAAGRVIRDARDAGVIVLVGERFAQSTYTRLMPADWYDGSPRELITEDTAADARAFWRGVEPVPGST